MIGLLQVFLRLAIMHLEDCRAVTEGLSMGKGSQTMLGWIFKRQDAEPHVRLWGRKEGWCLHFMLRRQPATLQSHCRADFMLPGPARVLQNMRADHEGE